MADDSMPGPETSALNAVEFFWRRRLVLILCIVIGLALGISAAFVMKPVYRAEAKIIAIDPFHSNSALTEMVGTFGGLAQAVGLGDVGRSDQRSISIELLESRNLARKLIANLNLVQLLDPAPNAPTGAPGAMNRALRRFDEEIRSVSEDRRTGIVTVAVEWFEPDTAANWANELVDLLNSEMRERALRDSERNLKYLRSAVNKTQNMQVKEALYSMIAGELQSAMVAEVQKDYALKIIDPASPPARNEQVRPKLWLLILSGLTGGFLIGFLAATALEIASEVRGRLKEGQ